MDNRGIALIMAMFVIVAIAIIMSAAFFGSINETNLLNRNINSMRALWLAEAGLSQAIHDLPDNPSDGYLEDNPDYKYHVDTSSLGGDYYQVISNGTVISAGQNISRRIQAILKVTPVNPDNFQDAIRTKGDLVIKGAAAEIGCNDEAYCVPSPFYEDGVDVNFYQLFQRTEQDVRSYATHVYTNPDANITPVEKTTWIELPEDPITGESQEFEISSDTWQGGCGPDNDCTQTDDNEAIILIVAGDAKITGGTFYGIIYVMGKLTVAGNPVINGTVLVESDQDAEIDTTVAGNVTILHDRPAIESALDNLNFSSSKIESWEELGYNP